MQIADDEGRVRMHRATIALDQIVEDHDLVIALGQQLHNMAANIAGAAGHQDLHLYTLHMAAQYNLLWRRSKKPALAVRVFTSGHAYIIVHGLLAVS